jgi:hypothetical protein
MSDAPQAPGQHLSLTIQLSDAPRGASNTRGTDYMTAVCQDRRPDGSCGRYTHQVDSDDVSISAI